MCVLLNLLGALSTVVGCQDGDPVAGEQGQASGVEHDRALYALGSPSAEPAALPTQPSVPPAVAATADVVTDVSAFAAARAHGESATLETITVYGKPQAPGQGVSQVRVVLGFDDVASFRRSERDAQHGLPRSVLLDLSAVRVAPELDALVRVGAAGLDRIRAFALDEHSTRVSFDLAQNTAYRLFFLTNPYRVILDFRVQAPRSAAKPVIATIVLDPGHGGAKDGARGPNGLEESVVALALAQRVKRMLQSKLPGARVVLTRTADRTVSLEERAAIANGVDADLFVSIHLDASPSPKDRGGVSTYVLDTSDDAQALRLAARENDAAEKDVTDLQRLFASLYREDQVTHSLSLADAIQRATLASGRHVLPDLADRGVQKALFYVLVGATMPAVLCEASFISRPEEAAALTTEEYRDALAEGIANGITAYASHAMSRRTTTPSAPVASH